MLIGQQLGPFLVEKEIGAGAMGAVYRGKYLKTGQTVAIKVMAPGVGSSKGSNAAARFEREAKILKQLNHPNIVRLFGVGKHQGMPFYAMEFIKGESLDRVMARRERMSWEEVVELGKQLCAALQHAHEAGIVHRDLKPSNLMILSDGTLKLTDFGIAKDLDVTALTAANCTIGTAAYMSPEQCKGDPNLTFKSDLYSLGIVLYELVTGRKPFTAENAMDMFMQHVNGKFERPSRIVLDVPIWLDNLICQLLEKKPEQRPRDAAMVLRTLEGIQEKVEAQQSAGVEAAKGRQMDLPREKRPTTEEDRAAARSLLGKRRKKKDVKNNRTLLIALQAGGIALALVAIIGVIIYAVQPPSGDKLYRQADKLWNSGKDGDRDRAYEGPIKEYLRRYGSVPGETTKKVRAWAEEYEVRRYEALMDRHVRHKTKQGLLPVTARTDGEKLMFDAAMAEHEGDRAEVVKLWQAVANAGEPGPSLVSRWHLDLLAWSDGRSKEFENQHEEMRVKRFEPKLDEFKGLAFRAWRQERLGDRSGARQTLEKLRESAEKDINQRGWELYAAVNIRRLKDDLVKKPQDDAARVKQLSEVVAKAAEKGGRESDRGLVLRDVVVLYGQEKAMADVVAAAKKTLAELDKKSR